MDLTGTEIGTLIAAAAAASGVTVKLLDRVVDLIAGRAGGRAETYSAQAADTRREILEQLREINRTMIKVHAALGSQRDRLNEILDRFDTLTNALKKERPA